MNNTSNLDPFLDAIARGSDTRPVLRLLHQLRPLQADGTPSLWGARESSNSAPTLIQNFTLEQFGQIFGHEVSPSEINLCPDSGDLEYIFPQVFFDTNSMTYVSDDLYLICQLQRDKGIVTIDFAGVVGYVGVHYFEAQGWIAHFGETPTQRNPLVL
jgi:hypothetical protein